MEEIWKTIKGFENYEISNYGNIKSLKRTIFLFGKLPIVLEEKQLKPQSNLNGYHHVILYNNGVKRTKTVHKLVAIAFLRHESGNSQLVVNHIDFNRTNNNVNNLEIVTQRENTNQKHLKSSSKYTGVSLQKNNKWKSQIAINGKDKHLGYFFSELEASEAYQKELKKILCVN